MNKFYSPVVTFGTQQSGPQYMGMHYLPNFRSDMESMSNGSPTGNFVHSMVTVSEFGILGMGDHSTMPEKVSKHHYSPHFDKIPSSKVIPFSINEYKNDQNKVVMKVKMKSKRAGPSNPIDYRTLCEVQMRRGKPATSKILGELNAGQTVVINQIKGRSGRVVEKDQSGKYVKKCWVSLFTASGRQLLVKCNV